MSIPDHRLSHKNNQENWLAMGYELIFVAEAVYRDMSREFEKSGPA
jgi:hypothetical protein